MKKGQAAIESNLGSIARTCRGQAAMEYLMTYGWALLALFVVLVALIASGIFAPGRFTPQECFFQPELSCSPFILYLDSAGTTNLSFTLHNGFGFPVKFTNRSFRTKGIGQYDEYSVQLGDEKLLPMVEAGSNYNVSYAFLGQQPPRGTSQKIIVNMNYLNCMNATGKTEYCTSDALPVHYASGRITATVEGS